MAGENRRIKPSRYWEVDTLRGVAVVLMIFFHLMWDLSYFGGLELAMSSAPWQRFARGIGTTFTVILGVSLVLSRERAGHAVGFQTYLLRGGKVFGLGLVITLVTYLLLRQGAVVFGILHMLGFCIVAAYPFLPYRRRHASLIFGLVLIGLGLYLNRQVSSTPWLIWLGITQAGRGMFDYYPVLPWFGVALVGVYAGHALYPDGLRHFALPDFSRTPVIRELSFLGRHSLLIYLIHQPILLGILFLSGIGSI